MFFQNSLFWSYEWNASFLEYVILPQFSLFVFQNNSLRSSMRGTGTQEPLTRCIDQAITVVQIHLTRWTAVTIQHSKTWPTETDEPEMHGRHSQLAEGGGRCAKKQGREIILPKQIMGFSISSEIKDMTYWLQETPDPDYWSQYTIGT